MLGLIGSLFLLVIAQPFAFRALQDKPLPQGCTNGSLTVVGSTAFEPVMLDLDNAYEKNCKGAPSIDVESRGSGGGISTLLDEGAREPAAGDAFAPYLSLSDGPAQSENPKLEERLVAVSVFALVVNKDVPLSDISLVDLQKLYSGAVVDWNRLTAPRTTAPGPGLQVTLVGRDGESGTRNVFEDRVLGGSTEPPRTSSADDCATRTKNYNNITRCEQNSTDRLLKTVAATPGAIGYAELNSARQYAQQGRLSCSAWAASSPPSMRSDSARIRSGSPSTRTPTARPRTIP